MVQIEGLSGLCSPTSVITPTKWRMGWARLCFHTRQKGNVYRTLMGKTEMEETIWKIIIYMRGYF